MVTCPKCGERHEFQSKSGDCNLEVYELHDCPDDVLFNVNRHSPYECDCGSSLSVDVNTRSVVVDGVIHPDTNVGNMPEQKYYPGIDYQPLFTHMSKQHGLTLTMSEMDEIIALSTYILAKK